MMAFRNNGMLGEKALRACNPPHEGAGNDSENIYLAHPRVRHIKP